jgi:hypothetical protein
MSLGYEHNRPAASDADIQREIARHLSPNYVRIDLTIPAQRMVANSVRQSFGLPGLPELQRSVPETNQQDFGTVIMESNSEAIQR